MRGTQAKPVNDCIKDKIVANSEFKNQIPFIFFKSQISHNIFIKKINQ